MIDRRTALTGLAVAASGTVLATALGAPASLVASGIAAGATADGQRRHRSW